MGYGYGLRHRAILVNYGYGTYANINSYRERPVGRTKVLTLTDSGCDPHLKRLIPFPWRLAPLAFSFRSLFERVRACAWALLCCGLQALRAAGGAEAAPPPPRRREWW